MDVQKLGGTEIDLQDTASKVQHGAIAGLIAAVPMSLAMSLMFRFLPWNEKYDLPPRQIMLNIAGMAGVRGNINDEPVETIATGLGHFGYSAATGAAYSVLIADLPFPVPAKGLFAGLLLYVLSYLGWLPAFNILPPATDHPRGRRLLMVIAHLIWGLITAIAVNMQRYREARRNQEPSLELKPGIVRVVEF